MNVRTRLSRHAVPVLLVALSGTVAACGNAPGAPDPGGRGTTSPTQMSPTAPDEAPSAIPTRTTPVPGPVCKGSPLGCRIYRSTGGRDGTGELAWLKSMPLEVSMYYVNETWTVGVKTPCNGLGVEVKTEAGKWIPGNIIATAMGCPGPESGYENWTHELFKQPVTWKLDGTKLVLHNSHGTVELRDAGPNPHM